MQENTVVQETTSANQGQISGQNVVRVVEKTETAETKRMKEHFNFFGPVTFLYAVFYAFCMFHNGSGITFPFFLAGTLLYFVFSLSKLEITLKKRKHLLHDQHSAAGDIHLLHGRMGNHQPE